VKAEEAARRLAEGEGNSDAHEEHEPAAFQVRVCVNVCVCVFMDVNLCGRPRECVNACVRVRALARVIP